MLLKGRSVGKFLDTHETTSDAKMLTPAMAACI